jgi:hypothetical protein
MGGNRKMYNKNYDNAGTGLNVRYERKRKITATKQIHEHQHTGFI